MLFIPQHDLIFFIRTAGIVFILNSRYKSISKNKPKADHPDKASLWSNLGNEMVHYSIKNVLRVQHGDN